MLKKLALFLLFAGAVHAQVPQAPASSSTGNITASGSNCLTTNACISIHLPANSTSVAVTITGTWSATLVVEMAADNGVTWVSAGTAPSANGQTTYTLTAQTDFRVRVSAFTSGTVGVFINSSQAPSGGGGGAVSSVFTRTGAVVAATNDYTLSQMGLVPLTTSQDILYDNSGTLTRLPIVTSGNCLGNTGGVWASLTCAGGSSGTWNTITNPAGNLALSMGTNTSLFNTTSAGSTFWGWKNTTAAIVSASQGSPFLNLCGRAWHGSADVEDCLTLNTLPGNGNDAPITFTIGHSGPSTGTVTTVFPGPIQSGTSVIGIVDMNEGTCAGNESAAGHDRLCADSSHAIKQSLNGAGYTALSGGGGSSQLDNQAPQGSFTTGDTTVQNMYTTTLASGLAAGACVELRVAATSNGVGTFDLYLLIGATQVDLYTLANGNNVPTNILLCNKPGVQNSQYWMFIGGATAGINSYNGTAAINFATSQTIGFGGKIAATGGWEGLGYQVEAQ